MTNPTDAIRRWWHTTADDTGRLYGPIYAVTWYQIIGTTRHDSSY